MKTKVPSICDTDDPYCLTELFLKELGCVNHLRNKMRNTLQCAECRQLAANMTDHLNQFYSYLKCEDCDKLLCVCGDYEESVIQNNSCTMHISIRLSCSQTKNIDKKIQTLKNKIETVYSNIQNLHGKLVHLTNSLQCLSQECSSLKNNCQQQCITMNELKSSQDTSEQTLLEIKQKIEDLHYASYDGSLMWKIDEFEKKFYEAKSGQKTSIYSPIFYSSPCGYKMRVRLDLYGDGYARGTHMSVFLVILKGKYDAILTWPFNFPVTFSLFDQSGQGHYIIDSFRPDTKSMSFQKPCSEENIASGILKFCPLSAIKQQGNHYVRTDTMFLKTKIDFLGIPTEILPYTLGLNPGLPTYEQEAQCRMEIEKHEHLRAAILAEIDQNNQEVVRRSLIHTYPPVPVGNRQQPPPSTTNSESMECEDILDSTQKTKNSQI